MKNTVTKGLVYYLFVLLSVVFGVLCIFAGILIFSPGTEIFGFSYSYNKDSVYYLTSDPTNSSSEYLDTLIDNGNLTKIIIDTDYYDVNVLNSDNVNKVELIVKNYYSGITKKDNRKKADITFNYNASEKSCTLKVLGPKCTLMFSNRSQVTLALPKIKTMKNVDLQIITQKGNITIGNSDTYFYKFKSLDIKSTEKSNITLNKCITFANSIFINSKSGSIYQYDTQTVTSFEIQTESAKIQLTKIIAPSTSTRIISNSSAVSLGVIDGDLYFDSKTGLLKVNKITGKFVCSERINIANITINEVFGEVLMQTANTSNITIDKCYGDCMIETTSGSVTINKMYANAEIKAESGKINVTFVPDEDLVNDNKRPMAKLITESGDIVANFNGILKNNNTIDSTSGNVTMNFNGNLVFTLNYRCTEKTPTFAETITSDAQKEGIIKIGGGSSDMTITITLNKGKLDVKDTFSLS